jgi:photosystem II stability/assembly factor-like uncharacterized protein
MHLVQLRLRFDHLKFKYLNPDAMKTYFKQLSAILIVCATARSNAQSDTSRARIHAQMNSPTMTYEQIKNYSRSYFSILTGTTMAKEDEALFERYAIWEEYWQNRCYYPGGPSGGDIPGVQDYITQNGLYSWCGSLGYGNWSLDGPNQDVGGDHNTGLASAVVFDPNAPTTMFAGTNHSGLFKSTNGGTTWSNVTDALFVNSMHVESVDVNPQNSSSVIFSMDFSGYSMPRGSILESNDGGSTWQWATFNITPPVAPARVVKFHTDPSVSTVFAGIGNAIYKKSTSSAFATWTSVFLAPSNHLIENFEFSLSNSNVIFASTSCSSPGSGGLLISSVDGGNTWNYMSMPNSLTSRSTIGIDVTEADNGRLYMCFVSNTNPEKFKVYSTISTNGCCWTLVADQNPGDTDFELSQCFEISSTNKSIFFTSGYEVCRGDATLSGNIFTNLAGYYHSDIRDMSIFFDGTTERLIIGCDGGVALSTDQGANWTSMNGAGLNIGQYYCVSSFQKRNEIFCNPQDDIEKRKDIALNTWSKVPTRFGESCWSIVDYTNDDHIYSSTWDRIYESTNNGLSWTLTDPNLIVAYNCNCQQIVYSLGKKYYPDPTRPGVLWSGSTNGPTTYSYVAGSNNWIAVHTPQNTSGNSNAFIGNTEVIAIAPSAGDIIYKSHGGATWGNFGSPDRKKLFKSADGGGTFKDISDSVVNSLNSDVFAGKVISSIVIDPLNHKRVFIAFGSLDINYRVIRSDDGGVTWTDMSYGLSAAPVNYLTYLNGTDDVIFAATDLGVYVYNKNGGAGALWYCFNSGLPIVEARKVEVDYCRNKVYLSTYGRGIYSSPIPAFADFHLTTAKVNAAQGSNHLVLSSNYNQQFVSNFSIDYGVKMTVNGIMRFSPTSALIVERGAQFNLTGTVTTMCDQPWRGVQVHGDWQMPPQYSNGMMSTHGQVIINGGTISNAKIGVATCKITSNGIPDGTYPGGYVTGKYAKFYNNRVDVQTFGYPYPSSANFANSTFETNGLLLAGMTPSVHVILDGVTGVFFQGCDFRNSVPSLYALGSRGIGITSNDANYGVLGICNSPYVPCGIFKRGTFSNLSRGIKGTSTSASKTLLLTDNDFTDTDYDAIRLNGMSYLTIERNKTSLSGTTNSARAGIYLVGCKNYVVTNNTITTSSSNDWGIAASNSFGGKHAIYKNKIDGGIVGISAQFVNASGGSGLKMKCNTFGSTTANIWDISVMGGSTTRVDPNQGTIPLFPNDLTTLVGNRYFADCTPNAENRWYYEDQVPNTSANQVQHTNNSGISMSNYMVSQSGCSDLPLIAVNSGYIYEDAQCPSAEITFGSSDNVDSDVQDWKGKVTMAVGHKDSLIDGGSTGYVLGVLTSSASNFCKFKLLDSLSPYLSDTVLANYFYSASTPSNYVLSVHHDNAPVTDIVWEILQNKGFSQAFLDTLSAHEHLTSLSERRILESQTDEAIFNLGIAYNDKIRFYLQDSTYSNIDTVLSLLPHSGLKDWECQNISILIDSGVALTDAYIDSVHAGSQFVDNICKLQKIKRDCYSHEEKWSFLISNNSMINEVELIAQDSTQDGYAQARGILEFLLERSLFYSYLSPDQNSPKPMNTEKNFNSDQPNGSITEVIDENLQITYFPNPTNGELNVTITNLTKKGAFTLEIKNILGQEIFGSKVEDAIENRINLSGFAEGIYLVSLYKDGMFVKKTKIILTQ